MSKLPTIRARDLVRAAERAGFVFDRQRGSHAVYYRESDRRRIVVPVHAGQDMKPGTLRAIITDMGLTVDEFIALL